MRIQWTHCVCRSPTLLPLAIFALLASVLQPARDRASVCPTGGALEASPSAEIPRRVPKPAASRVPWIESGTGGRDDASHDTTSGRIYQTSEQNGDFENWQNSGGPPPPVSANRVLGLAPGSADPPGALRDLVTSPANPEELVAATDKGIFRSADAAKSWTSLNDGLPNLPVLRLLRTPSGDQGLRIELAGQRAAEWPPGEKQLWIPADNREVATEARLRTALGSLAE